MNFSVLVQCFFTIYIFWFHNILIVLFVLFIIFWYLKFIKVCVKIRNWCNLILTKRSRIKLITNLSLAVDRCRLMFPTCRVFFYNRNRVKSSLASLELSFSITAVILGDYWRFYTAWQFKIKGVNNEKLL